jgi:hypothetical protein
MSRRIIDVKIIQIMPSPIMTDEYGNARIGFALCEFTFEDNQVLTTGRSLLPISGNGDVDFDILREGEDVFYLINCFGDNRMGSRDFKFGLSPQTDAWGEGE